MWKRPDRSRTSVERTSGAKGSSACQQMLPRAPRTIAACPPCGPAELRLQAAPDGALACTAVLAACGGGVYLGIELGDSGDDDPSVALTAAVSEAPAGATVRLAAAASDDFGVDAVSFYREDAQGAVLLGTDGRAPYELDTVIPASAPGTVWRYFARARRRRRAKQPTARVVDDHGALSRSRRAPRRRAAPAGCRRRRPRASSRRRR